MESCFEYPALFTRQKVQQLSCRTFSGVACFLSPPQSSNVDEKAILHCWTAAMLVLVSAAVFCGIVITGLIKNRMKVNKDS